MLYITFQGFNGFQLAVLIIKPIKPTHMKTFFQLSVAILLCSSISAQSVITRLSAGADFYYYNNELQTALNDASPGDTILLPGNDFLGFNIPTSVVLVGVGYDPLSSAATGTTLINGSVTLNAPNTEVIGLRISGTITFGTNATNSVLQRCRGEGTITFASNAHDILITECVMANPSTSTVNSSINISTADNIEINNSYVEIITASSTAIGLTFNNNVIFDGLQGVSNAMFSCNVFNSGISVGFNVPESNNIFNDNVVLDPGCTDDCLIDLGVNNVALNTLFLTATSVFGENLPDYAVLGENYLILDTSPAFTHCPVNQQVGVFGGPQPLKIGAIPFNPHISSKTISGVSTTDQINVTVGVEAQDN